jgi:hypothetical protein
MADVMADDTVPTGRQQLENKHPVRQLQQAARPRFQPGKSFKFVSEKSSNTTGTVTPAQKETDQQTLVLSERHPVGSSFLLPSPMTLLTGT